MRPTTLLLLSFLSMPALTLAVSRFDQTFADVESSHSTWVNDLEPAYHADRAEHKDTASSTQRTPSCNVHAADESQWPQLRGLDCDAEWLAVLKQQAGNAARPASGDPADGGD